MFSGASNLHTIEKFVVKDSITLEETFKNCDELQNITFDGVIGVSIDFSQSSKLTNASVQSAIDYLKDLTGATAKTLTLHATVGAKLTQAQKDAISAKNWTLVY
jgi:uncharacterized protein related to proFAR isomerase